MATGSPWTVRRLEVRLPPDASAPERRAADLLRSRIRRRADVEVRLAGSGAAGEASGAAAGEAEALVEIVRRPDLPGPEAFRIATLPGPAPTVRIEHAGDRAAVYAAGHLLRHLEYLPDALRLAHLHTEQQPAFPCRGYELRLFVNDRMTGADGPPWDVAHWDEVIGDLALWGCNLIRRQVISPSWATYLAEAESGAPDGPATRAWQVQREVCRVIKSYGLDVGIYFAGNRVADHWAAGPHMTADMAGTHPYPTLVCASHPATLERIFYERERMFRELPYVDQLFMPSGDSAGCDCPRCHPWSLTYLRLGEQIARLLRRYHPEAEVWITNQHLNVEQDQLLWNALREDRPGWLQAYTYGPAGNQMSPYIRQEVNPAWFTYPGFGPVNRYLAEIRAQLPPEVALTLFPDLTHWIQAQYGTEAADPAVARLNTRRVVHWRPAEIRSIFERTAPFSSGSVPYTEGLYDDLHKALWLQWHWDPAIGTAEALRRYGAWWFGRDAAAEFAALALDVERTWQQPAAASGAVEAQARRVAALEGGLAPRYRAGNWRWDLVALRALLDHLLRDLLERGEAASRAARAALLPESPPAGAADLADRLRRAMATLDAALRDAGVAALRAAVRARLDAVAEATGGLALPAGRQLEVDPGHTTWERDRLAAALAQLAAGDLAGSWAAAVHALTWEEPGAGGCYDDLGHPAKQPHLARGHPVVHFYPQDPVNRPSQNTYARSYRGEPGVRLVYDGLDPAAGYEVELSYVAPPSRAAREFAQRLEADVPGGGAVAVHQPITLPVSTATRLRFAVPAAAYAAGRLDLTFIPENALGATAVSEAWLRRVAAGA